MLNMLYLTFSFKNACDNTIVKNLPSFKYSFRDNLTPRNYFFINFVENRCISPLKARYDLICVKGPLNLNQPARDIECVGPFS